MQEVNESHVGNQYWPCIYRYMFLVHTIFKEFILSNAINIKIKWFKQNNLLHQKIAI